jgi:hypothetical protein
MTKGRGDSDYRGSFGENKRFICHMQIRRHPISKCVFLRSAAPRRLLAFAHRTTQATGETAMDLLSALIALLALIVLVAAIARPLRPLDDSVRLDDTASRANVHLE